MVPYLSQFTINLPSEPRSSHLPAAFLDTWTMQKWQHQDPMLRIRKPICILPQCSSLSIEVVVSDSHFSKFHTLLVVADASPITSQSISLRTRLEYPSARNGWFQILRSYFPPMGQKCRLVGCRTYKGIWWGWWSFRYPTQGSQVPVIWQGKCATQKIPWTQRGTLIAVRCSRSAYLRKIPARDRQRCAGRTSTFVERSALVLGMRHSCTMPRECDDVLEGPLTRLVEYALTTTQRIHFLLQCGLHLRYLCV